jgi:DNA-binding LytR/AlgR family response regulator
MLVLGQGIEERAKVLALHKILIVEDDALIAMELAERLTDLGHAVLGPAHSISEAEALIDANLAGQSSVSLGMALVGRGVPVAFCTGYDHVKGAPPELASAPVLVKPYSDAELKATLAKLVA